MRLDELAGFFFTVAAAEVLGLSAWFTAATALDHPGLASWLFCWAELHALVAGWRVYRHFAGLIVATRGAA